MVESFNGGGGEEKFGVFLIKKRLSVSLWWSLEVDDEDDRKEENTEDVDGLNENDEYDDEPRGVNLDEDDEDDMFKKGDGEVERDQEGRYWLVRITWDNFPRLWCWLEMCDIRIE